MTSATSFITGSSNAGQLNTSQRDAALDTLRAQTLDVVVIGGGVVGAGAAVDAASRGLTIGIIEANDWASGTSSRSSKLVHGGIRYLEQLDFKLVREAFVERGLLLRTIAPHLVHPVPFLFPLTKPGLERLYVGAGMLLYDIFSYTGGRRPGVPLRQHISRTTMLEKTPSLRPRAFRGGLRYFDAQVDDARLVVTLIRTAVDAGAAAATHVVAVDITLGTINTVTARDEETGQQFEIHARAVLNATGVWTEESQAMVGGPCGLGVTMSKGVDIVVDRERLRFEFGMILRAGESVLLVIAWGQSWLIGTTDTPWDFDKTNPIATSTDIQYLLDQINRVLGEPLTRADVRAVWSGLRPLVRGKAHSTAKLSREHVVDVPCEGIAVIAGGKLTTYRVVARDAVNAALEGRVHAAASCTRDLPLIGASDLGEIKAGLPDLLHRYQLSEATGGRLLRRYGDRLAEVLEPSRDDPSLAGSMPDSGGAIGAEVRYAVTHEGASHLEDVLERRLRITMESSDFGLAAAPVAAGIMAGLLGWGADHTTDEVSRYNAFVDLQRSAMTLPDDASASAAMTAEDARLRWQGNRS